MLLNMLLRILTSKFVIGAIGLFHVPCIYIMYYAGGGAYVIFSITSTLVMIFCSWYVLSPLDD